MSLGHLAAIFKLRRGIDFLSLPESDLDANRAPFRDDRDMLAFETAPAFFPQAQSERARLAEDKFLSLIHI